MSTVQPSAASYDGILRRLDAARPHVTVCPRCRPRGLQWVAVGLPCSSGSTGSHRRSGGRRWHPDEWPCAFGALAERGTFRP